MEKILPISLNVNFSPNTYGCYGLMQLGKKKSKASIVSRFRFKKGGFRSEISYCRNARKETLSEKLAN